MILTLLEKFFQLKFETLNSSLPAADKLKQIESDINWENIPDSEQVLNWQLYITNTSEGASISEEFDNVNIRLDFIFFIGAKDRAIYKRIFDMYIWPYRNLLRTDQEYKNLTIAPLNFINGISNIAVTNADRFEGNKYMPSIESTLFVSQS